MGTLTWRSGCFVPVKTTKTCNVQASKNVDANFRLNYKHKDPIIIFKLLRKRWKDIISVKSVKEKWAVGQKIGAILDLVFVSWVLVSSETLRFNKFGVCPNVWNPRESFLTVFENIVNFKVGHCWS